MRQLIRLLIVSGLAIPSSAAGQILPDIVNSHTQSPGKLHYPYDMEADGEGNIWLYGFASDTIPARIGMIVKFSDYGQTLDWVHEYHDCSLYADIDIDEYGNVYMAATICDTVGGTGQNYLVRKIDVEGNVLWSQTWTGSGSNNLDRIYALCVDGEGAVIATGVSEGANFSGFNWATVKYDEQGNLLWTSVHVPPSQFNGPLGAFDVTVDAANGIYVTGESHDESNGDFTTIKYRPDGTEAWLRREGGIIYSQGKCVRVKGDKVVVGGSFTYADLDSTDALIAVYDTSGSVIWSTIFDAPHPTLTDFPNCREVVSDLAMDDEGNVVIAGTQFAGNGSSNDYLIVKLDLNGDTLWHRHYGPGTNWSDARSLFIDGAGSVFTTGMCENTPTGYGEMHTLKYDSDGALQWIAPYAPSFWESCMEGIIRWDGADRFYVGSSSNGPTTHQLLLLGYSITTGYAEEFEQPRTTLGPNPTTGNLTINLILWTGQVRVRIVDAAGRFVYEERLIGDDTANLDINELAPGTYALRLSDDRHTECFKLIVE